MNIQKDAVKNIGKRQQSCDPRKRIAAIIVALACSSITGCQLFQHHATKEEAAVAAKNVLREKRQLPATAQFPPDSQMKIVSDATDQFEVTSYVDFKDSYGTMMRSEYSMKIRYLPGESKWFANSLKTQERQLNTYR